MIQPFRGSFPDFPGWQRGWEDAMRSFMATGICWIVLGATGTLLVGGANEPAIAPLSPFRVEHEERYDSATGRWLRVERVYFQPAGSPEVLIEKSERAYEQGALVRVDQTLYDPATAEKRSQVQQQYGNGALLRDDRVLYKGGQADQWFLHMYHAGGRRERMQYGNYYQPFVSLQARDIELYRDDVRNTKSHSEVRTYFPNPQIAEQGSDKFNIEMCHHKREWELREDGSPFNFQHNEYGNQLSRVAGKLEHQHIQQINIDYAADGQVKPNGYREKRY